VKPVLQPVFTQVAGKLGLQVDAVFTHGAGKLGLQVDAVPHVMLRRAGALVAAPETVAVSVAVPAKVEGVKDVLATPVTPVVVLGAKNVPCEELNVTGRPETNPTGSVTIALTVTGTPQVAAPGAATVTVGAAWATRSEPDPRAMTRNARLATMVTASLASGRNMVLLPFKHGVASFQTLKPAGFGGTWRLYRRSPPGATAYRCVESRL
jgi:hypothetical protein